jgi:hypothetical protein
MFWHSLKMETLQNGSIDDLTFLGGLCKGRL